MVKKIEIEINKSIVKQTKYLEEVIRYNVYRSMLGVNRIIIGISVYVLMVCALYHMESGGFLAIVLIILLESVVGYYNHDLTIRAADHEDNGRGQDSERLLNIAGTLYSISTILGYVIYTLFVLSIILHYAKS